MEIWGVNVFKHVDIYVEKETCGYLFFFFKEDIIKPWLVLFSSKRLEKQAMKNNPP